MLYILKGNEVLLETFKRFVDRKLCQYHGVDYVYSVLNKDDPSKILIISSYPDKWVNLYIENNIQHIDPVIFTAFRRVSPFAWDENITLISDLKFKKIFKISNKYNIVNGYTFVLHDHLNNLTSLSFIIDSSKVDTEDHLKSEWCTLQMLLIEINEQMHKLKDVVISNNERKMTKSLSGIFTARENEVMYWVSKGKCYADIAGIIGISLSTVKFHVKNVVKKLGVNNARQAIGLSVELNLIKKIN